MPYSFYINDTTKKIGGLSILKKCELSKDKMQNICWECVCDCGVNCIVSSRQLKYGTDRCTKCMVIKSKSKGYEEISGSNYSKLKYNAKTRSIDFNVTISDIWQVFIKQDKKCALSGIDIHFTKNKRNDNSTASLDRIDNTIGYIPSNVQWIHRSINEIKRDMNENELLYWCNKVVNKQVCTEIVDNNKYSHHGLFKGHKAISAHYFAQLKRVAKVRNITFNITYKEIWTKFESQKFSCAVTGIPIFFSALTGDKFTASVDRINSNLSYTYDNIQIVHKDVNQLKWDFTTEELGYYCHLILEHSKNHL